jgi:hypothetical protein
LEEHLIIGLGAAVAELKAAQVLLEVVVSVEAEVDQLIQEHKELEEEVH